MLVLFRLDTKKWKIPGRGARASFPALVDFLKLQATKIRADVPLVETLDVVGIDCVEL